MEATLVELTTVQLDALLGGLSAVLSQVEAVSVQLVRIEVAIAVLFVVSVGMALWGWIHG